VHRGAAQLAAQRGPLQIRAVWFFELVISTRCARLLHARSKHLHPQGSRHRNNHACSRVCELVACSAAVAHVTLHPQSPDVIGVPSLTDDFSSPPAWSVIVNLQAGMSNLYTLSRESRAHNRGSSPLFHNATHNPERWQAEIRPDAACSSKPAAVQPQTCAERQ
jgi:hypothetical protein